MININIHVFPDDETFSYSFDENKRFKDLKNELIENNKIYGGEYYIEKYNHIIDEEMILKDNGMTDNSNLDIINSECIKIEPHVVSNGNRFELIQNYMLISDLKAVNENEKKPVNVCHDYLFDFFFFMLIINIIF